MFGRKKDDIDDLSPTHPLMWVLMVLGSVVALAVLGFGGYYGYEAAKTWRAHSLIAEGKDLVAHGSPVQAGPLFESASHLAPYDLDVLRACGSYEVSVGHRDQALNIYQVLIEQKGVTRQDWRDAMEACLTFGKMDAAEGLSRLLMAKDAEAADYSLKARMLWQEHTFSDAIEAMRKSLAMDTGNRTNQVLLAQFLLEAGTEKEKGEAVKLLEGLTDGQDAEALRALVLLSQDQLLPTDERKKILDELRKHPLLDDEGRFAAWDLEARLKLRTSDVILQEACDFYKKADLPLRAKAARWLYSEGASDVAMQLATLPDSWKNQDLFKVRLDVLTTQKNWKELKSELGDSRAPLSQAMIFMYRASVAGAEGNEGDRELDWEKARSAAIADPDPAMLPYMAQYAIQNGLWDEAKKTYSLMAKTQGQEQEGYNDLVKMEHAHGTSEELLETLTQMKQDFPSDEVNDGWAYMSLLLNKDVDEAFNTAVAVYKAHPEVLSYRTTVVLGCLRTKDLQDAANLYNGVKVDWNIVPLEWRAVRAAALAAGGQKAEAEEAALGIDRSRLRTEERELLNEYLPEQPASSPRHPIPTLQPPSSAQPTTSDQTAPSAPPTPSTQPAPP